MKLTSPESLHDLVSSGIEIRDPSSISDFLKCPRLFYHRHEEGLTRIDQPPSYGLQFGISIHKALAHWLVNKSQPSAVTEAVAMFTQDFLPHEEKPTFNKRTGKEINATYTVVFGCSLLLLYFSTYASDVRPVLDAEIPVAEELTDDIFLAGRIDVIYGGERQTFADHKTTKYPEDFILVPNLQFMTYKYLTSKLAGSDTTGELDLLVVSKTKDSRELLSRKPFDYSTHQMSEWRESVTEQMRLIKSYRARNYWPQSWRCRNEYHQTCAYLPLCASPVRDSAEQLKTTMYRVEFWNPLQIGA